MTEANFFKQIEKCSSIADLAKIINQHPKLRDCLASWNDIYVKGSQVKTNLSKNHSCSLAMLKENVLEDADNLTHPTHYGDTDDPMSPASKN